VYPVSPSAGARFHRVSSNVVALGMVSLLTDVSSEMITSVLPLYLAVGLNLSPAGLGIIDGLHQAGASIFRLLSGWLSDRSRRYKLTAFLGYAVSALCKLLLFVVGGGWYAFAAITLLDRVGKGARTAPRDALISLSSTPESLGRAFGVHRTLDTTGAMLGPLVAFGLLRFAGGSFDAVFVVSFAFALVGLAVLVTFVRDREPGRREPGRVSVALPVLRKTLGEPRVLTVAIAAFALGAATVSDGLLYFLLQRRIGFDARYLPLLYVATPAVFMAFALPLGRLADRLGRARIVVAGYFVLLLAYLAQLLPGAGFAPLVLSVVLLGLFYAATDGVLMAVAGALLPEDVRGSGLALVTTAQGLGRLLASVVFGILWSHFEEKVALSIFSVIAAVVVSLAGARLIHATRASIAR
jgi:MFS family permease